MGFFTQHSVLETRPVCGAVGSLALDLVAEDYCTGTRAAGCWTLTQGRTSGLVSNVCVQVFMGTFLWDKW